jgi:DNA polymerase III sliding clamp (beta) subunit (PCNA family)
LQNIYLKASIDTLVIRATDMEKYIEVEMPCTVQIEGSITVNAKTFLDVLKTIESDTVELSVDQKSNIMTIKTVKDTFEIYGIAASEYVALPEVPQDNSFVMDTTIFVK